MRNALKLTIALAAALIAGASQAQTAPDTFLVNANVTGRFNFVVTTPATKNYDFGNVTAGNYTAPAAFAWSCFGSPKRNVTISLGGAVKTQGTGPTDMALGQLAIQFSQATVKGVLTGTPSASPIPVDSPVGTALLSNIVDVGNGANTATGTISLYLTVDGTDSPGPNTWNVTITATQL